MSKKNLLLWINYLFLSFSFMKWNVLAISTRRFCRICQSSILKVLRNIFRENKNKEKVQLLNQCRTLTVKMSNFWHNYSNGLGKTAFYLSIGTVLGKPLSDIDHNNFDFLAKKISGGVDKTAFYASIRTFLGKNVFIKLHLLFHFPTVSVYFLLLCWKFSNGVVRKSFHVSNGKFRWTIYFSNEI